METKDRTKALKNADFATIMDIVLYIVVLVCAIAAFVNNGPAAAVAGAFIVIGLLRIRILLRAIRTDALLREAEAQALRLGVEPYTERAVTSPRTATCPKCHIATPLPADYTHSSVKCPHCAHTFRLTS